MVQRGAGVPRKKREKKMIIGKRKKHQRKGQNLFGKYVNGWCWRGFQFGQCADATMKYMGFA